MDAFFAKQKAVHERDRLRTLFDITLSNIIGHDHAVLTLRNEETGTLDLYALHSTDPQLLRATKAAFNPAGMPAEEVLATGKPIVAYATDVDRYPNPNFRRFVNLGLKSICSVPLILRNRIRGTLALSRLANDEAWSHDDVEFLAQVATRLRLPSKTRSLTGKYRR